MPLDANGYYYPQLADNPPQTSTTGEVWHSTSAPDPDDGDNGDIWINTATGDIYFKAGDVWDLIAQGPAGGSGEAGVGSPEGVVTAAPGTTYTDTGDGSFYVKASGSGNTGWLPISGPAF